MNYVVWDIETDSAQTDWATMLEVGAILLDNNFKEIERFEARCRYQMTGFQLQLHYVLINLMLIY